MEAEEPIHIGASSDSKFGSRNDGYDDTNENTGLDSQCDSFKVKEEKIVNRDGGRSACIAVSGDGHASKEVDFTEDLVENPSITEDGMLATETVTVKEKLYSSTSLVHGDNEFLDIEDASFIHDLKIHDSPISSIKTVQMTFGKEPFVHVIYSSLPRDSKGKLEELLQKWSEWHTKYVSSHDQREVLESGEETWFPAIQVGLDKPSAVSFRVDSQTRKWQDEESSSVDGGLAPLYDRGYALGLTDNSNHLEGPKSLEMRDVSRCFNCGSYNHTLKQCPKPRDSVAVNNARKQQKSRRNQNPSSRNVSRYYQNSPGGKYDGLRPGALNAKTRQLLGLGELDPPPWLNRMREIGYPPGYLVPEDEEDRPSGITIYADEEINKEEEEGEIIEEEYPNRPTKMGIDFPGINAPIPENADEWRWAADASSCDPYISRPYRRSNRFSESNEEPWPIDSTGSSRGIGYGHCSRR